MNVDDITSRVKRQFGDESGVQITNADIIRWINDAQRDIVMKHNLLQTKGTSNVVGGTADYSVPADLLNLHSVRFDGRRLIELSIQEVDLEGLADNDSAATGVPQNYTYFANILTLYPTPVADVANGLTILYTKQPTVITINTDPLTVPESYHNAVVHYCLQMAYELDENWQAAQAKNQSFNSDMTELRDKAVTQPEEFYPHITYTDMQYFDQGWGDW